MGKGSSYRGCYWSYWSFIYCISFSVTKDTKLQDFQYKLIHRILSTNSFLYKYGLKETELCTFCTETKESLVHIFWECNYVRNFWLAIGNFLKICGVSLFHNSWPDWIQFSPGYNQQCFNYFEILYIYLQMQMQGL